MLWTAIVNPVAGRGRRRGLAPKLHAALAEHVVAIVVSNDPQDPPRIARDIAEGGGGVVACGGDGLVAAVAGVCAETDTPLAIVPTGSGNDFARAIGLDPRRPTHAIQWIQEGAPRRVDLGRVTHPDGSDPTWFTTVANTGFDAEANRWANTVRRLSGTTLYLAAIARTLATYRPTTFRISVDGGDMAEYRAWLLACANSSTYAGGMKIAPDARIDDGRLEVTVVGDVGRAAFLANLPRVASGSITKHPRVTTLSGRSIVIEAVEGSHNWGGNNLASKDSGGKDSGGKDSGGRELWASGERVGLLPRSIEVVPGALVVQGPQSSSRSNEPPSNGPDSD